MNTVFINVSKYSWLLVFLVLGLTSCTDEKDIFTPYEFSGDIDNLHKKLSETDILNLEFDPTIENAWITNNRVLEIKPYSIETDVLGLFLDECNLKLKEFGHKSGMIFNDLNSVKGTSLLSLDYIFSMDLEVENSYLSFVDGMPAHFKIPFEISETDILYKISSEGKRHWFEFRETPLQQIDWEVNNSVVSGYSIDINSNGWFGVGHLVEGDLREIDVCITLPKFFNDNNTSVYAVFDGYNSILKLNYDNESKTFCERSVKKPFGAGISIVTLSVLGESDYYFGQKHGYLDKVFRMNIAPDRYSSDQIIQALKEL